MRTYVRGSNGCKIPGSKVFFGHEILNVELTDGANTGSGNVQQSSCEEHLNVEKFQPYRKTITLDDEEEFINFVVIDEFHEKFLSAVMDIKAQHVIGVGANGVGVFEHGRLCWLQIATKSKVYLFDILVLGPRAFKNGLAMILEKKHTLKVIHDCRALAGCLIAQFGVKLTNVFDTQVADVMCFYSNTGGLLPNRVSTLQEVVSLHLKVPSYQLLSLQMMSQLTKEEREMWYKRPCPVPLLKVMALSVIHLQTLRFLLLDTLMTDYMTLVDSYLSSSQYQPDELEHVSMESALELPKELRQLEQMRIERQKWAADRFPTTEQGLLARFNPQTPSQTSPAAEEHGQKQADSFEPEAEESPPQADPLLHEPPKSPPIVDSVSADSAQAPDINKQMSVNSPLSLGVGRGRMDVPMDTMGRGMPFGKEQSSIPALPAIGRGLLLQMARDQSPRKSNVTPGWTVTAPLCPNQEVMPLPGHSAWQPENTFGEHLTPKSLSPSLLQSFRSFRS
ncbi:piRNA biogenesis protein EXD1 isoform X2 [Eleginops maclovinus]|uniref:piRNA biogenesis protein EXD1 isoform X2 n=1 Tax=Eleginops maclovinus TaxID=56733 RepID=UPI00308045C8